MEGEQRAHRSFGSLEGGRDSDGWNSLRTGFCCQAKRWVRKDPFPESRGASSSQSEQAVGLLVRTAVGASERLSSYARHCYLPAASGSSTRTDCAEGVKPVQLHWLLSSHSVCVCVCLCVCVCKITTNLPYALYAEGTLPPTDSAYSVVRSPCICLSLRSIGLPWGHAGLHGSICPEEPRVWLALCAGAPVGSVNLAYVQCILQKEPVFMCIPSSTHPPFKSLKALQTRSQQSL